jgi:hypothetical protein
VLGNKCFFFSYFFFAFWWLGDLSESRKVSTMELETLCKKNGWNLFLLFNEL